MWLNGEMQRNDVEKGKKHINNLKALGHQDAHTKGNKKGKGSKAAPCAAVERQAHVQQWGSWHTPAAAASSKWQAQQPSQDDADKGDKAASSIASYPGQLQRIDLPQVTPVVAAPWPVTHQRGSCYTAGQLYAQKSWQEDDNRTGAWQRDWRWPRSEENPWPAVGTWHEWADHNWPQLQ